MWLVSGARFPLIISLRNWIEVAGRIEPIQRRACSRILLASGAATDWEGSSRFARLESTCKALVEAPLHEVLAGTGLVH